MAPSSRCRFRALGIPVEAEVAGRVAGRVSSRSDSCYPPEEQSLAASNDYSVRSPGGVPLPALVATLRKTEAGQEPEDPRVRLQLAREDWLLDMKIFVDTDSDIRLVRRLCRVLTERGRDIEGVIKQYHKFVKPAFEQNIEPP
ncbi:hypothetical protein KUCAC02_029389 [Chaenocephalus aceratus]|nr:hypothetical protein KUCAC02_029389 [Chaenocephalus aceratus]